MMDACKLQLAIDYDTADKITILNLIDAYRQLRAENEQILGLTTPQPYRLDDYKYNVDMMYHIQQVLQHFGSDIPLETQNDKTTTD